MSTGRANKRPSEGSHFVRDAIVSDQATGRYGGRVATRFPPEPNGYLHIGHAKAIAIDFGLAREFAGTCNLRFDDTNPTTEEVEYVDAIKRDIRWLGWEWDQLHYASDYFEELYGLAVKLIENGKAYVEDLPEEQIREYRGDFYKKGRPTPSRDRPIVESLDLFARMRAGEFPEGSHVLRAKIDLDTQNMNLRDPVLYRIRYAAHHRTGTKWCIYPMYDFAHPLCDAIEKITHSICTVEFEAHRPLYDWFIKETESYPSQQIEFARGNLTYTVMSKRKLLELVETGRVSGWDDPRMPTLAGLRRRGYTPEAIRTFWERVGVAKSESVVDVGLLEHTLRQDLEVRCPRAMAVLRPLKVVIQNFPEGDVLELSAPLHPTDSSLGTRMLALTRVVYIDRDDFREDPPEEFFRLAPGREVRLRYACLIRCVEVIKDEKGEVVELHCTWDPASAGGTAPDGRRVLGTLHWISGSDAVTAEVRLYDRLFSVEHPEGVEHLNPNSIVRIPDAMLEKHLSKAEPGSIFQFERLGYFFRDQDGGWNRTVTLKDSWTKIETRRGQSPKRKKAGPS